MIDRKQILTISAILQHCESWKKAENEFAYKKKNYF